MPEYLFRRNTVLEALKGSRRELRRLWLQEGADRVDAFLAAATQRQLPVETAGKRRLSELAGDSSHQGLVLETGPYPYSDLDEMFSLANRRDERPFLLLLDLLHGPQNIGALLRVAEACGVHGVILQDRRAPDITPAVVVYSSGAAEHLLIAQVTNLPRTIEQLKAAEVWIAGLDPTEDALALGAMDLDRALGVVIGHEGRGLRRLVRERCDFLVRLPMRGRVDSLNAATAGAIILYAAWGARDYEGDHTQRITPP